MANIASFLIPIVPGVISFLVHLHNISKDKSSLVINLRDEVKRKKVSAFVVEHLFSVIYRINGVGFTEISILINNPSPLKSIQNYLAVKRYINAISLKNVGDVNYIVTLHGWQKGWRRKIRQIGLFLSIFLMYVFSTSLCGLSYNYFHILSAQNLSLTIKNTGFPQMLMDVFIHIAAPLLFSLAGYRAFRGWLSSVLIDSTVNFFIKENSMIHVRLKPEVKLRQRATSMTKLVRQAAETALFIALFCVFASVIDASKFISLDTANNFAVRLHGHASQENYDDLWFYTDVVSSLLCATLVYQFVIRVGRRIISKATPSASQR